MSYLKTKRVQLGDNVTASNNFVLRQPDTADGTMRISNGIVGAETDLVTVTSAGNVGIGTSSPEAKLDVKSTLAITEASAANSNSELTFYSKFSNSQRGYVLLRCESLASGSSDLAIRTRNSFVEAERMRIDSAGRVTMPNQTMVFATRTAEQAITTDESAGTVVSCTTIYNIGGNYNTSNNRFTAPVAGYYEYSWSHGTFGGSQSVWRSFIWTNGSSKLTYTQLRNDSQGHTGYVFGSRTAIIYLTANDYAEMRMSCDAGHNLYADTNLRFNMTIRLIQ